jgi:hypothetical protein
MKRTFFLILITGLMFIAGGCAGQEPENPPAIELDDPAADVADSDTGLEAVAELQADPQPEPEIAESGESEAEAGLEAEIDAVVEDVVEEATEKVSELKQDAMEEAAPVIEEIKEAVADVTTRIEVPATNAGATRIGATKCKMCHKVQFTSWQASSHAGLDPVLDCESCHGPGSLYKKKSVMKVRKLAEIAGMVLPDVGFCTESCHSDDWNDKTLAESHDHKPAS